MFKKIGVAFAGLIAAIGLLAVPAQAVQNTTPHGVPTTGASFGAKALLTSAFKYAGGQDTPATGKPGYYSNILVANPAVVSGDHSLMEMSVQAGNSSYRQAIVETGWVKDNATGSPYLFASIWVNNIWCGSYVGGGTCGWVDYTPNTTNLGASLSSVASAAFPNNVKKFGVQYDTGNWWVSYDNNWLGYFPGTKWSTASPSYTFSAIQFSQVFMEVYSASGTSCTDGGSGTMGSTKALPAAYFGSAAYSDGTTPSITWNVQTNPTEYTIGGVSLRTGYAGGPGPC